MPNFIVSLPPLTFIPLLLGSRDATQKQGTPAIKVYLYSEKVAYKPLALDC